MNKSYNSNQIFYIKGIGYARINSANISSIQLPVLTSKNDSIQSDNHQQSILFDPQMFNIDGDLANLNQHQEALSQILSTRKLSVQSQRRASSELKIPREPIVVPLKIQQTNAMIYCPDNLLMKKINLSIKSSLQNIRKSITVSIEIVKTIDNLKNLIFKQLNEEIGYYSDIRLITIIPILGDLNIGSKTVWQCGLKDKSKILLTAKFNFTFKYMQDKKTKYFSLTNGNNTLANNPQLPTITAKKQQQPKNPVQNPQNSTNISQSTQADKNVTSPSKNKEESVLVTENNSSSTQQHCAKQIIQQASIKNSLSQRIYLECNPKLRSGMHYWQFKIDRLTHHLSFPNKFLMGINAKFQQSHIKNNNNKNIQNSLIKLWGYDALRCKKIQYSSDNMQKNNNSSEQNNKINQNQIEKNQISLNTLDDANLFDESDEQDYGSVCKAGDSIGVFLFIKEKNASLTFYKNSVCLNQCYLIDIEKIKQCEKQIEKKQLYFCPFVLISGDLQITLDSKATQPLDCYRFK